MSRDNAEKKDNIAQNNLIQKFISYLSKVNAAQKTPLSEEKKLQSIKDYAMDFLLYIPIWQPKAK